MRTARLLPTALAALLLLLPARPATAQSVTEDLVTAVVQVEEKLLSLARAIPESEWDWRPGPGVRSVAEVLKHVAYDNFYFPTAIGRPAPDATGITDDYATARAWGERELTRDEILEALDASLVHLRSAMIHAGDGSLGRPVTIFDREMDRQELWLLATTHLHEHLGQLIAYARMRGVVPPWSASP